MSNIEAHIIGELESISLQAGYPLSQEIKDRFLVLARKHLGDFSQDRPWPKDIFVEVFALVLVEAIKYNCAQHETGR